MPPKRVLPKRGSKDRRPDLSIIDGSDPISSPLAAAEVQRGGWRRRRALREALKP